MKKIFVFLIALFVANISFAKDNITIGMRLEPPHLDPTANSAAAIDEIVYGNIFEGLFQITKNGGVSELLATDYDISPDGKTYTITIKDTVYFHNGDKLTADDVVFSISRIFAEKSINPRKSLFTNIQSIKKIGKYKVMIKLKKQSASLIYNLALPDAVIFNRNNYKNNKNHPIGTGAFAFVEMKKGYFVKLKQNRNYHDKFSKLKSVKFRFISDGLSASNAILSGEVDGFPIYQDVMTLNAFKNNNKFKIVVGSTEGETLVALNNKHKQLSNVFIRRALTHAIDKQALVDIVAPNAKTIGSHYPPHGVGYVELADKYPYNPKLAKKMLAENGAKNLKLEFTVPPSYKLQADVVAGYLRKVGVQVKMKSVDWGTWLSGAFKGKYDITIVSHVEPRDYTIYANPKYYFGYDNKYYQYFVETLQTETNKNKRIRLLKQIQNKLANDAVNIWLYQSPKIGVWNKNVQGYWENSPVEGNILKNVYWK